MEESKEKVSMSEEKGKISVIVPVYQAEKYLAKALDSVISQDYRTVGEQQQQFQSGYCLRQRYHRR